jgi:hypothetical protein
VIRLLCLLLPVSVGLAQPTAAEKLIEAGHWKRARTLVEARIREAPDDALSNYLLSQIRNAFGEHTTPLPLAEKAEALDGRTAKYHRQVAEVLGVMAQRAGALQQLFLAPRFRKEIDAALALDSQDVQALRDLLEFYLLAPGIAGGDSGKAAPLARRIGEIDDAAGFMARARIAAFHKQTAETEALLRQAGDASPPNYGARIALARFYIEPGHFNPDAAEMQAKAALILDRGRVDAYGVLAETGATRGAWNELESTLTASAASVPDDLVPYYRAAARLIAGGRDPARAERYLRAYLGQEPEGNEPPASEAHWKLGLALQAAGREADAIQEWQESIRLDPESKAALELRHARGKAN